jgi:Flp pilus assembly protein TadG
MRRLREDRRERERGSATFIMIGWALVLWFLLALVVDVGLAISQRERAGDLADQAARAEAQNLNLTTLRTSGTATIVPDDCVRAAEYLNDDRVKTTHMGTAALDRQFGVQGNGCQWGPGNSVTVSVDLTYTPLVFDLFGAGTITVNETGTATVQSGTN